MAKGPILPDTQVLYADPQFLGNLLSCFLFQELQAQQIPLARRQTFDSPPQENVLIVDFRQLRRTRVRRRGLVLDERLPATLVCGLSLFKTHRSLFCADVATMDMHYLLLCN